MFFTRTYTHRFPISKEELTKQLVGKHVQIHNLDFEVVQKEHKLSIIPHAEQIEEIKTLPITSVVLTDEGGRTKAVIKSKMRQIDSGGPFLIIIFCMIMFVTSVLFYWLGDERVIAYTLFAMSVAAFSAFWFRLQTGYFDYVRKIHAYVKSKGMPVVKEKTTAPMAAV